MLAVSGFVRNAFAHTFPMMLVSLGLAISGCSQPIPHSGKERADVVIKLTYGGQPITSGDVDLNNLETGEGGGGSLDKTGTVRIGGVVLGDYIVTVQPPISGALPGTDTSIAKTSEIPTKFQTPERSTLRLTVHGEGAEATFDLKP